MRNLIAIIFLLFIFGSIYYLYNRGNLALFFNDTIKVNAQVDSIKPVRGTKGRGWHQKVFYTYIYKDKKFTSNFKNDATMWNLLSEKDSLQLKIEVKKPNNNKVIGVYFVDNFN